MDWGVLGATAGGMIIAAAVVGLWRLAFNHPYGYGLMVQKVNGWLVWGSAVYLAFFWGYRQGGMSAFESVGVDRPDDHMNHWIWLLPIPVVVIQITLVIFMLAHRLKDEPEKDR